MDKNKGIIEEVMDEIESSLRDSKGIVSHQRRLAFSLSLGSVILIEDYLKKKQVFKSGAKINHLWFKKKKENAKRFISNQITSQIESLPELDSFLDKIYEIEKDRNEMAYGKLISEEKLKEKINLFLNLKKEVENA